MDTHDSIVEALRALLAGKPMPEFRAPYLPDDQLYQRFSNLPAGPVVPVSPNGFPTPAPAQRSAPRPSYPMPTNVGTVRG